jgi:phenylacetate-CoA ligase
VTLLNRLLESVILPLGDVLTKGIFISNLKELRNIVSMSENELNELQKLKLKKVLVYAKNNSNYYQGLNIQANDLEGVSLLKKFPILDKQTLKNNQKDLLTCKPEGLIKHSSSGSTGFQSTVFWSIEEQSKNRATQILWWEWAGYKFGDPLLQTGINPKRTFIKKLKDIFLNTYYIQAFSHSKEDVLKALKWAQGKKNPVLAGYASSLFVFSQYAKETGIKIPFKAAVCWGDKLFSHYRNSINEVFQVKISETYGSAEGLMIAAQADLSYMYIMTPNVYIEIVDDNGNEVPDGIMGHVIVTNLNAFAMPLIRYRIGDLAIKLPKEKYPEKRKYNLPILQMVIGRDTDLVKTKSGKYMVVHSFTGIFEHIPQISQFCVVQENLEGIKIMFIPDKNFYPELLQRISDSILDFLQEDFNIEFVEVDFIPPTKSGKPQLIVSKLNN